MSITGQETSRPVRLVEEVPGVPEHERYFVCGGKFDPKLLAPIEYPHFSTKAEAETFLANEGITDFVFEPFEL